MSFSTGVKKEIMSQEPAFPCCLRSMAYGMLIFGRSFNINNISMMTDSEETADTYIDIVSKATGAKVTKTISPSGGKYILSVDEREEREKVFAAFNLTGSERSLRINRSVLTNEGDDENNCCFASFIKGAFLSCGTVCDPNKMYTLEFIVPYMKLSEDLFALLKEAHLDPKSTTRRGIYVVYFKDSSNVEDILALMGAAMAMLEIVGIKALKDVRNRVNRVTNFDNANISKTVNASSAQIDAINLIEKTTGLDDLPQDIKEIAILRREYPEMSLRELGEEMTPPISRSGVNHRLMKLIDIAKKIKSQQ